MKRPVVTKEWEREIVTTNSLLFYLLRNEFIGTVMWRRQIIQVIWRWTWPFSIHIQCSLFSQLLILHRFQFTTFNFPNFSHWQFSFIIKKFDLFNLISNWMTNRRILNLNWQTLIVASLISPRQSSCFCRSLCDSNTCWYWNDRKRWSSATKISIKKQIEYLQTFVQSNHQIITKECQKY